MAIEKLGILESGRIKPNLPSTETRSGFIPTFASDSDFVTAKGIAATKGDLYFDTTIKELRRYDGSSWYSYRTNKPSSGIFNSTWQTVITTEQSTSSTDYVDISALNQNLAYRDAWGYVVIFNASFKGGTSPSFRIQLSQPFVQKLAEINLTGDASEYRNVNLITYNTPGAGNIEFKFQYKSSSGILYCKDCYAITIAIAKMDFT
jgi:hypothetical protein